MQMLLDQSDDLLYIGGQPLKLFESIGREGSSGWGMKEKDIFELAEYFPGGSTNFEEPLNKALELLQKSKFKGGTLCLSPTASPT
jgi:hypothetical protein